MLEVLGRKEGNREVPSRTIRAVIKKNTGCLGSICDGRIQRRLPGEDAPVEGPKYKWESSKTRRKILQAMRTYTENTEELRIGKTEA